VPYEVVVVLLRLFGVNHHTISVRATEIPYFGI
jgi:hypothetical protein